MRAITATVLRATDKSPDAAKQADAEADRAMDWLRKAVAASFNTAFPLAAELAKDKDLDALRERADFKKLTADLQDGKENRKK